MGSAHEFQQKFSFSSRENAEVAMRAIAPELKVAHERRTNAEIDINKNTLMLKIKATNKKSLKATPHTIGILLNFIKNLIGG